MRTQKIASVILENKKQTILHQWEELALEEIRASQSHSSAALINFLPIFLDQLIDSLKTGRLDSVLYSEKMISIDHGIQRAQLKHYTVDQVVAEYALLEEVILKTLHEEGSVTAMDCSIIAQSFMAACSGAASAFVKSAEQSEVQFKRLVEEAKDIAILILDPNGVIQTWNAGAARINQFTESDVIGKNFRMLYRSEDQAAGRPEANLKAALTSGRHSEQWWRIKKDGSVWWAEVILSTIHSPSGKIVGLAKIFHDLTEKKRAEDELLRAKAAAETANQLKSSFLANMSHEIRTPLGVILGLSEVLKDPSLTAQQREELFRVIDRNGKVLLRLIDDILDFTKIEAGKLELLFTQVQIRDVLQDVIASFQEKAADKGIFITLDFSSGAPTCINTDAMRVRQILSNLLSNAVKFTDHGGVRVIVHPIQNNGSDGLEMIVSDTGTGIPDDQLGRIFGEFNQADASVTRKYGGAGLGLALSRKLARELGGDLELVDCSEKIGCTFRLLVSNHLEKENNLQLSRREGSAEIQSENQSHYPHLKESKVLFIEDSHDEQLLVHQILSQFGVKVEIAPNAEESIKRVEVENFDAVLMDIHQQVGEGLHAIEELREHGFKKPIVAISEKEIQENRAPILQKSFNDFLVKPINSVELLNLLEKWIADERH